MMLSRYYVAARLEDLTRRAVTLGFVPPGRMLTLARVESPVVTDRVLPIGTSRMTIAGLHISDFNFCGRSRHSESQIRTQFLATLALMKAYAFLL
jgi:hypothetical protein